jgi:hypothetical protein
VRDTEAGFVPDTVIVPVCAEAILTNAKTVKIAIMAITDLLLTIILLS